MENINSLTLGTKLKQYRILSILGQGGFGITYLAEDEDLKRKVAIKECYPNMFVSRHGSKVVPTTVSGETDFGWALDKFRKEATTLAQFKHPGIVQVLQILEEENNTAYMVLEFVNGQSLEDWLSEQTGQPTEIQLKELTDPLLTALNVVHKNNYTHRDIAPDNIYIRSNSQPVLLDFGSAKQDLGQHSKTMNLVVKDGYSPPEQYYVEGNQGPWTDIYAFAATLYRAVTGERPVDAMARLDAINNDRADPLKKLTDLKPTGYSQSFLQAVDVALEPQVKKRPQNIEDWWNMLFPDRKGAVADETRKVIDEGFVPLAAKRGGGAAKALIGGLMFVLLSAVLGGGGYYYLQKRDEALDLADWRRADAIDSRVGYRAYLEKHPQGRFADRATEAQKMFLNWERTFGGNKMDAGHAIATLPDGGFVVVGRTEVTGNNVEAWLLRLSASGKLLWERKFGGKGIDIFKSVAVTPDGAILAAGRTTSKSNGGWDAFVVRVGLAGEVEWEKKIGLAGNDWASAISAPSSDEIYIAGMTQSQGQGGKDGWVVRLDRHGKQVWNKTYGYEWDDELTSIGFIGDDFLVVAGSSQPEKTRKPNFWQFKLDRHGVPQASKLKSGTGKTDRFHALATLTDGSVLLAGNSNGFGTNSNDAVIFKVAKTNKFAGLPMIFKGKKEDHIAAIDVYDDGSMVVAGYTKSKGQGSADAWIMKISANRQKVLWERVIGTGQREEATGIVHLEDGGAAFVGMSESQGSGMADLWVVKLDKNGRYSSK